MGMMIGNNVGLNFVGETDRKQFAEAHKTEWEKLPAGDRTLQRLLIDGRLQYYTYKSKIPGSKRRNEFHYRTDTRTTVEYPDDKVFRGEDNPFGIYRLNFFAGEDGKKSKGLLFVRMPDGCARNLKKGWYAMQIAAYPETVFLSHSKAEYKRLHAPFRPECLVPLFRPREDGTGKVFTEKTVISGNVEAYEMRTNTTTGLPYYWVKLRCLSLCLDMLIAPDALPPDAVRQGDILTCIVPFISVRAIKRVEPPQDEDAE